MALKDETPAHRLTTLATKTIAAQERVQELQGELKLAMANLVNFRERELPELMDALEVEDIVISGFSLTCQTWVRGSLPKDPAKKSAAIATLCELGGEPLIKNEITVSFAKGHAEEARNLFVMLSECEYAVHQEETVHPQTLAAFARELASENKVVPYEDLGLTTGRAVKVKQKE